jgi:hypothetical protein
MADASADTSSIIDDNVSTKAVYHEKTKNDYLHSPDTIFTMRNFLKSIEDKKMREKLKMCKEFMKNVPFIKIYREVRIGFYEKNLPIYTEARLCRKTPCSLTPDELYRKASKLLKHKEQLDEIYNEYINSIEIGVLDDRFKEIKRNFSMMDDRFKEIKRNFSMMDDRRNEIYGLINEKIEANFSTEGFRKIHKEHFNEIFTKQDAYTLLKNKDFLIRIEISDEIIDELCKLWTENSGLHEEYSDDMFEMMNLIEKFSADVLSEIRTLCEVVENLTERAISLSRKNESFDKENTTEPTAFSS